MIHMTYWELWEKYDFFFPSTIELDIPLHNTKGNINNTIKFEKGKGLNFIKIVNQNLGHSLTLITYLKPKTPIDQKAKTYPKFQVGERD